MARLIVYAPSCDVAAESLGGYERIDRSLDSTIQALMVNPYAFPIIESDFYRARYVRTLPIGDIPSLVWIFEIDTDNNVTLTHVEEAEDY